MGKIIENLTLIIPLTLITSLFLSPIILGQASPRGAQPKSPMAAPSFDKEAPSRITPISEPKVEAPFLPAQPITSPTRSWTTIEVVLSVGILIFGIIVLILGMLVMWRMPGWTPNTALRLNGLTLIITCAILLVTAGYSSEQTSSIFGLLGTIAGYLLGASDKKE